MSPVLYTDFNINFKKNMAAFAAAQKSSIYGSEKLLFKLMDVSPWR